MLFSVFTLCLSNFKGKHLFKKLKLVLLLPKSIIMLDFSNAYNRSGGGKVGRRLAALLSNNDFDCISVCEDLLKVLLQTNSQPLSLFF